MKTRFFIVLALIILTGCSSSKQSAKKGWGTYGSPNVEQKLLNNETFVVDVYSDDATYGYTQENPIMEGGGVLSGARNERRFLNALMGPDGEPITYTRLGSCCGFKTKNGLLDDGGLLDMYQVAHKGLEKEVILYINMYDSDTLKIPVGFKKKK